MKAKDFNAEMNKAFGRISSDHQLIEWTGLFWINNNLTDRQTAILDRLKFEASQGRANSPYQFYDMTDDGRAK